MHNFDATHPRELPLNIRRNMLHIEINPQHDQFWFHATEVAYNLLSRFNPEPYDRTYFQEEFKKDFRAELLFDGVIERGLI